MRLSLITLTWNSAAHLGTAVDSVLRQDGGLLPTEYLFVDGGSSDGTLEIIDRTRVAVEERGAASQLIHQNERSGIYGAKNLGARAATGDYVAFLHSDDWYAPYALRTMAAAAQAHPDADMLVASLEWMRDEHDDHPVAMGMRPLWQLPVRMPIPFTSTFIKRSAFDRIGWFDEAYRISGDYDWMYRAHKAGLTFVAVPAVITNMRLGGTGLSNRDKARLETLAIGRAHCAVPAVPWLAYTARRLLSR